MSRSVATEASFARTSPTSRWLDQGRWRRILVLAFAVLASVGIAAWGGFGREELLKVNRNEYVAVAGLFVAALGVERLNELLVAPWVGRGDPVINRNVLVGSFGLLFGVTVCAALGLSGQSLFDSEHFDTTTGLNRTVGIFVAGLAIAGGGKPLHDLISRLEKNVEDRKGAAASATETGAGSLQHRISVDVEDTRPDATASDTISTLSKLLPGWNLQTNEPAANKLVTASTFISEPPGTAEHRRQLFAAAHRIQSQNHLLATPQLGPIELAAPTPLHRDQAAPAVTEASTPLSERRWHLAALGLDANFYDGNAGCDDDGPVRVAVLDTGVFAHPDGVEPQRIDVDVDVVRVTNIAPGASPAASVANWIFDGCDFDVTSSRLHGTSVASVIAAAGNTQRHQNVAEWWATSPMIGVAPDAEIMSVRVMRGPVHLGDDDVRRGVLVAAGQPADDDPLVARADVISMSLGGFGFKGLADAIQKAIDSGVILVCAAGNNFSVVVEPAFYGNTVAVAATTRQGRPYEEGSSRGPEVDVAAPGHEVPRANFDGNGRPSVEPSTGTTYATAHVSGVAALWLAHHGRANLRQWYPGDQLPRLFKHLLRRSTRPWDPDELRDRWGTGIVDVPQLLADDVFEQGATGITGRKYSEADLADAFPDRSGPEQHDRIAAGMAAVLTGEGTLDIREAAVSQLAQVPALLVAEVGTNTATDPVFRARRRSNNPADLPIPAGASQELTKVLGSASAAARRSAERRLATGTLDDTWGIGVSGALRSALQGRAEPVKDRRYLGVVALAVAIAMAAAAGFADRGLADLTFGTEFASLIGFFAIGVYAAAQAIERFLEFTIARTVYRDVPGREADRALILLGVGVALGVGAAIALDIGLIASIAETKPAGAWDEGMDAMITGLAVGGGAKPVHDLLTRIRLPLG